MSSINMNTSNTHISTPPIRLPRSPLTRILCWTITPAVLDAGGVSSTPDMIKELSVSLPAVRTILPGPLAPGPELAAVDHRDSPQQRASARESGLAVVTLATRECDPDRSKKLAGCSRVTAARRRRPRARCPVHGARCTVPRRGRESREKKVGRDWRIRTRELENKPATLPTGLRGPNSLYVGHLLPPPFHPQSCRHRLLFCRSLAALRCLPEMGG